MTESHETSSPAQTPGYRFKLPKRVITPPERLEFSPSDPPEPFDFRELFGREAPVEIEIGFGKGRFLVEATEQHPEVNYLGIEWSRKFYTWTLKRFIRRDRSNVRLINGNAAGLVKDAVPRESVAAFHIYFPDPWPKKRHRKRRLLNAGFIDDLHAALVPGGMVHFSTDFLEYGFVVTRLFQAHEGFAVEKDIIREEGAGFTNFEDKYLREGRPIMDMEVRKQR